MDCRKKLIPEKLALHEAANYRRFLQCLLLTGAAAVSIPTASGQNYARPSYTPSVSESYFYGDPNEVYPNPYEELHQSFTPALGESTPVPNREVRSRARNERRETFRKKYLTTANPAESQQNQQKQNADSSSELILDGNRVFYRNSLSNSPAGTGTQLHENTNLLTEETYSSGSFASESILGISGPETSALPAPHDPVIPVEIQETSKRDSERDSTPNSTPNSTQDSRNDSSLNQVSPSSERLTQNPHAPKVRVFSNETSTQSVLLTEPEGKPEQTEVLREEIPSTEPLQSTKTVRDAGASARRQRAFTQEEHSRRDIQKQAQLPEGAVILEDVPITEAVLPQTNAPTRGVSEPDVSLRNDPETGVPQTRVPEVRRPAAGNSRPNVSMQKVSVSADSLEEDEFIIEDVSEKGTSPAVRKVPAELESESFSDIPQLPVLEEISDSELELEPIPETTRNSNVQPLGKDQASIRFDSQVQPTAFWGKDSNSSNSRAANGVSYPVRRTSEKNDSEKAESKKSGFSPFPWKKENTSAEMEESQTNASSSRAVPSENSANGSYSTASTPHGISESPAVSSNQYVVQSSVTQGGMKIYSAPRESGMQNAVPQTTYQAQSQRTALPQNSPSETVNPELTSLPNSQASALRNSYPAAQSASQRYQQNSNVSVPAGSSFQARPVATAESSSASPYVRNPQNAQRQTQIQPNSQNQLQTQSQRQAQSLPLAQSRPQAQIQPQAQRQTQPQAQVSQAQAPSRTSNAESHSILDSASRSSISDSGAGLPKSASGESDTVPIRSYSALLAEGKRPALSLNYVPERKVFKDFTLRRVVDPNWHWCASYIRDLNVNEEQLFNTLRVLENSKLSESRSPFSLIEAGIIASRPESAEKANRLLNIYENIEAQVLVETARIDAQSNLPLHEKELAKAEAILNFMHSRVTHEYRLEGTTMSNLLEFGRYNCVTASILFCSLAEKAGLDVTAVELPGHAMCWIKLANGERLKVETTCNSWFKYRNDPETQEKVICKLIRDASPQLKDVSDKMLTQIPQPISDKRLIAKIYYNRGVDLLALYDYAGALEANAIAYLLDPQSKTTYGNLLATMNNWAIELCREKKFEKASKLLCSGLEFNPNYPPFRNNHTHVYHLWVRTLYESGEFEEAIQIAERAAKELPDKKEHFVLLQNQIRQMTLASQKESTVR